MRTRNELEAMGTRELVHLLCRLMAVDGRGVFRDGHYRRLLADMIARPLSREIYIEEILALQDELCAEGRT